MPTAKPRLNTIAPLAVIALGAACALTLPGCNIVAPVVLLAHGPPRVPAAFTLPPERAVVVLIDTTTTNPVRPAVRNALAEHIGLELLKHGGVTTVIDARSAASIASMDRLGNQMPVSEVGRAVGAEIVVHVMIESFGLTPDGQTYTPTTSVRIKVIDATNEERLFPEQREGQPVVITKRVSAATLPARGTEWTGAEMEFAEYAGIGIAQMFYEHERNGSHLLGRGE